MIMSILYIIMIIKYLVLKYKGVQFEKNHKIQIAIQLIIKNCLSEILNLSNCIDKIKYILKKIKIIIIII